MTDEPTDRDPKTGQFIKGHPGPSHEEAKIRGQLGGLSRSRKNLDLDNSIAGILRARGYEPPFDPEAYEHCRLFVVEGNLQAWDRLERIAPIKAAKKADATGTVSPDALHVMGHFYNIPTGERCSWCGTWNHNLEIDVPPGYAALVDYYQQAYNHYTFRIVKEPRTISEKGKGLNSQVKNNSKPTDSE